MRTKTFNLKVSTIELKEKLLSHFKTNPFFDTLAEIIIDSIDNENNLARLYSYVAGIAEPISMVEVAENNAKQPTVTWNLKYPLQSINEKSILAQVGEMKHEDLIVEDGRVFARIDTRQLKTPMSNMKHDQNNWITCIEMIEQFTIDSHTKDYKGHLIKWDDKYSKYQVLID